MCLICIELDRQTMNVREARRALGEMRTKLDRRHTEELEEKLDSLQASEPEPSTAKP